VSSPVDVVAGLVLCAVSGLLLLAATIRLSVNGYLQRRGRSVRLAGIVVGVVAGVVGATLGLDGFLAVGITFAVLAAVFLAVAWLLPVRTTEAAFVAPRPSPPAKRRTWLFVVVLAYFVVWGVVSAVQRDRQAVAMAVAGTALFAWLLWWMRRAERASGAETATVPPGAGPVVFLRAMPRRSGERVTATYLTMPIGTAVQLVEPRRLVDPAWPADDWQTPVATLLRTADRVLLFPDDTQATRWELALMAHEGRPEHLFVYVPNPANAFAHLLHGLMGVRMAAWPELARMLRAAGLEPPGSPPPRRALLTFDGRGRATVAGANLKTLSQIVAATLAYARPGEVAPPNG
jgi:hypothetical protein